MDSYKELQIEVEDINFLKNEIKNAITLKEKEKAYIALNDKLRNFFGGNMSALLYDVLSHDAIRLVTKSSSDITPEPRSEYPDENIEAMIPNKNDDPEETIGSISKIIGDNGIPNGNILYYKKGEISRSYNFYNGVLYMDATINGVKYSKRVKVVSDTVVYNVDINYGNGNTAQIIVGDMYSIQDIIKVYAKEYKCPEIHLLFPEIFDRVPLRRTKVQTRK